MPLLRVPWSEPWLAKPVLDAGAYGINFPMVSTPALGNHLTIRPRQSCRLAEFDLPFALYAVNVRCPSSARFG